MSGIRGATPVASTTSSKPLSVVDVGAGVQSHVDAVLVQHSRVVADRLAEFFLAGNPSRQVELAADDIARLEESYRVAALRGRHRRGKARRTRADHRDASARAERA